MSDSTELATTVNQRFHVEKSISVGHILTTIIMLVTAFSYFSDFDKRMVQAEQGIEFMKYQREEDLKFIKSQREEDLKYLKSQRDEDAKRVEKRLDSIDKKLDQLLSSRAFD